MGRMSVRSFFFALMEIRIPIYVDSLSLQKAEIPGLEETDYVLPVKMIANKMVEDKDGEIMHKSVFDDETVKYFLEKGHIDWWHRVSKNQDASAMLGKPVDFKYESEPIVYGYLLKANPIVRDSIMPSLKANLNMYSASMGGGVIRKDGKYITKIYWDNMAIAPRSKVRSEGSDVSLAKAENSISITYGSMQSLYNDLQYEGSNILSKALEAQAVTSMDLPMASIGPLQGLAGSVYHGKKKEEKEEDLDRACELFSKGYIHPSKDSIERYFLCSGYPHKNERDEMVNQMINLVTKGVSNGSSYGRGN